MLVHESLQSALSYYQSGGFLKVIALCQKILEESPEHIEALQLLGLSHQSRKEFDLSIPFFEKITRLLPDKALGYFNLANVYYLLEKYDQADLNYQRAAEGDSTNDHIFNNWGTVLREKGDLEKAVKCFQKAIQLNPVNAKAFHNLGNVLADLGRNEGAVSCYRKAQQINPDNGTHYKCLGKALREKGDLDEAIEILRPALDRFPDDPEVYYNLGAVLKDQGRFDEAVACYRQAIKLNPDLPETYYNLGNVFKEMGRLGEAEGQFKKALVLNPRFAEAYTNLGVTLKEGGDLCQALMMYQKALEIKPDLAEARWNMGLTHLLSGNFSEGWIGYEWRWEKPDYKKYKREFPKPIWTGEGLSGQRIFLHAEQGYGDTIQFIRYVPLVAEKAAHVYVECPRDLKNLIEKCDGISQIFARGDSLPEFDVHCPLLSLPKVFGTTLDTIPGKIPYLQVEKDLIKTWQRRLDLKTGKFKVGLVWSGNPEHHNDRNRSCPLQLLAPLARVKGILYYSLQKGRGAEEVKHPPEGFSLIDLTDQIRDFSDTAAFIENLDLIISVDTAVAHLAGALGRRVWTLLPHNPDWRWLLDREDSPWYPTMRLYRQRKPGDWSNVVQRVIADLHLLSVNEDSPSTSFDSILPNNG